MLSVAKQRDRTLPIHAATVRQVLRMVPALEKLGGAVGLGTLASIEVLRVMSAIQQDGAAVGGLLSSLATLPLRLADDPLLLGTSLSCTE